MGTRDFGAWVDGRLAMKPAKHRTGLLRQIRRLALQIQNQAHLNQMLNTIPDAHKRRQFFETVKPSLRFKAQYPMEVTHGNNPD